MDLVTKELLINFLFILLALCLLQILYIATYAYRSKEVKSWEIALFPIISLALCMVFPVYSDEENIWSLCYVPFILGGLYGGYKLGLAQLSIVLLIRYVLGGMGFYTGSAAIITIGIAICVLSKYYLKLNLKQKLLLSVTILVIGITVSQVLEAIFFSEHITSLFLFEYYSINIIGIIIATILWEAIRMYSSILQNLIKAEKLQMVSHLAASISHEVRNPLTVSRGFMQLLSEDLSPEKSKEFVHIALKELDRATDIINDYLTFAKPAVEKNEKININEEIQQAINVINPLATMNGVEIEQTIYGPEHNPFMTIGERKKFQQCLINIMKNGIESMTSKGGKLHIHLSGFQNTVKIDICDQGIGMSQEQINRLGEPYFTTKEKGTGLGMMVSYSIIKGMNGTIHVNSELRKGTSFKLVLPAFPL
ncbi:sensor histidine kinase [Niallia endozanthoxylica]|uniref:histidine kinase n=1 Tax=Niallia endozanthoxylica TaxID=2036016 RepID=A0A5J5I3T9_9BACI|nr:HAMP domain-containing sensor histidine kinase [Niallia endozanthoxylica]KAA9031144.1 HAMP domain-containing histidine kinase [Niallia endozanthoxylica]